jgi:hypothetical protein
MMNGYQSWTLFLLVSLEYLRDLLSNFILGDRCRLLNAMYLKYHRIIKYLMINMLQLTYTSPSIKY